MNIENRIKSIIKFNENCGWKKDEWTVSLRAFSMGFFSAVLRPNYANNENCVHGGISFGYLPKQYCRNACHLCMHVCVCLLILCYVKVNVPSFRILRVQLGATFSQHWLSHYVRWQAFLDVCVRRLTMDLCSVLTAKPTSIYFNVCVDICARMLCLCA